MPMICVLAQANVGDHYQLGHSIFDRFDGALHDPFWGKIFYPDGIFRLYSLCGEAVLGVLGGGAP